MLARVPPVFRSYSAYIPLILRIYSHRRLSRSLLLSPDLLWPEVNRSRGIRTLGFGLQAPGIRFGGNDCRTH